MQSLLTGIGNFGSLPLFSWVSELWDAIVIIIPNSIDFLNGLIERINAVEFTEVFAPVLQFLGIVRYFIGDVNYLLIVGTFYISAGFLFYKLINKLIGLIMQIFEKSGFNSFIKVFKA